jgi:hypothetical protein
VAGRRLRSLTPCVLIALFGAAGCGDDGYTRAEVFEQTQIESGRTSQPSEAAQDIGDVVNAPRGCTGVLLTTEDAIAANPAEGQTTAVDNAAETVRVLVHPGEDGSVDCVSVFGQELDALE